MLKPFNLILSCRLHSLVSERSQAYIVKKNGFKVSQVKGIMNKSQNWANDHGTTQKRTMRNIEIK